MNTVRELPVVSEVLKKFGVEVFATVTINPFYQNAKSIRGLYKRNKISLERVDNVLECSAFPEDSDYGERRLVCVSPEQFGFGTFVEKEEWHTFLKTIGLKSCTPQQAFQIPVWLQGLFLSFDVGERYYLAFTYSPSLPTYRMLVVYKNPYGELVILSTLGFPSKDGWCYRGDFKWILML